MTIITGEDADDDPRTTQTRLLHSSSSPSENWDDDFEFQAGMVASAPDNAHDAINALLRPGQSFQQEESWDDAYEDENTHASPVKRTSKVDDDDVEDWDSSDNELETNGQHKYNIRHNVGPEFGVGGFEEEDKTVTARSTSSRPPMPPPPLPLPIPPSHSTHQLQAHTVLPPPTTSPTLSTFSIPLSSTTRDRASIYSQDPLMPSSNSSAPHLSVIRSYPHAAGSTPPRKGRRLRKKSRPPEADIFELEDRDPDPIPAPIPAPVVPPQLDLPPPTTPPRAQHTVLESPSRPVQPSAPPTPSSSILTRIGSFKRWARRSMGPDDPVLSGWRRSKSSIGPTDAKVSHGPSEVIARGGKSSTGPESRPSMEDSVELDSRAVSPTPPPGRNARRSRGESASGQKSGWFFRAGGATGSEEVTPTVQAPPELTPSKRGTSFGLRRRIRGHAEDEDDGDREGKTPTPRKVKGKPVPLPKAEGSAGVHRQEEPTSPTRASRRPSSPNARESWSHKGSRPMSLLFPLNGMASVGRSAGLPLSGLAPGSAMSTSLHDDVEKDGKMQGESKEKESRDRDTGMRGLMNGVRRLSLVNAGPTHKRTKSTGSGDAADAARKDIVKRPRSQLDHYSNTNMERSPSDRPISRLASHQGEANGLLPPVELMSSIPGLYARRGSLPWVDYDQSSAAAESRGPPFLAGSALQPPQATDQQPAPQSRRSCSTIPSSPDGSPGQPSSSAPPIRVVRSQTAPVPIPVPVPMTVVDAVPPTRSVASTAPPEQRSAPDSRQSPPSHFIPSSPQSASLGRSTASPSHSGGLRRNSLGDLKTPLNTLGQHKAQLPPLGELKIPARISRAQQGLRRDMGMVREFAGCVEQLKRLQGTYIALLSDVRAAYEASPGSPSTTAAHVQFHLPSRPPSQTGAARKAITSNSNPSVQNVHQAVSLNSPIHLHSARSFSRASHEIGRELIRLEHEYGIWWECAELLIELGGGSGVAASTASNPNLAAQSTSTVNTPADDPPKLKSSDERHAILRPIMHVSSMSEPGSLFEQAALPMSSTSKGPPQASPPHPSQWRASTGRHDLSARQLRLLKDMLNTPDPACLAYAAGPYGYGAGYPHPHPSHTTETQPWAAWNPSAVTLPSEESSADADAHAEVLAAEAKGGGKEKKRRVNRLGMLGLREILRGLKRNAVAEGRINAGDGDARGQQGSESSMSNSADDDRYNRRRSPWHQEHGEHHTTNQNSSPELTVVMAHPPARSHPQKSPRRPSLASIFRIGNKNVKSANPNGKDKENSPGGNGDVTPGEEPESDLAAAAAGEYSDWERMSRSDLDLTAIGSGTATVRAKKAMKAPGSHSSINLNYPYSTPKAVTPKKAPAASQSSLWDSSPSSATSPQPSRLPLSIAEENGGRQSQESKNPEQSHTNERTASWSQAHPLPRPVSRTGKSTMSGTVRSAPPNDFSPPTPALQLALTPENIKPLLEYAKVVDIRLTECISEVQVLLGASPKGS